MKYFLLACLMVFSSCASHKEAQQRAYVITQQLEASESQESPLPGEVLNE